jgi:hypothetical protein
MRRFGLLVLAGFAGCAGCAHDAAPVTTSSQVKLDPQLAPIAYFAGDWTARAENPQTKKAFVLRYTVQPTMKGAWLEGTGFADELGLELRDYWTVDDKGEVSRTIFDSTGITGTVRGTWSGDTLVLEGSINAGARVRETITKRGERTFDAVWESNTDGVWTAYSVEHLTR